MKEIDKLIEEVLLVLVNNNSPTIEEDRIFVAEAKTKLDGLYYKKFMDGLVRRQQEG